MSVSKWFIALLALSICLTTACSSTEATNEVSSKPDKKIETEQEWSNDSVQAVKIADTESVSEVEDLKEKAYPEPYLKAIEKMNAGDIEMALSYLDMTLEDFEQKDVQLKARTLKNYLLSVKLSGYGSTLLMYLKGADQYKEGAFADTEGLDEAIRVMDDAQERIDKESKQLKTESEAVLEMFQGQRSEPISDEEIKVSSDYITGRGLSFFESVGYPLPTQSEIDTAVSEATHNYYKATVDSLFKDGEIDYAEYFYAVGFALMYSGNYDESAKNNLQKVIDLTEDDKYSETRLNAKGFLENIEERK
ncbi:hypothetical protein [Saccharibacillus brassicae]|uniref:Tetratricopeptide repeat protein n=1 Tax=Saccharibacillus brassicae TaxID=2583377 RepID=A0A4Y6US19_SACBS|nr:hypothetical protein [Saccharibacillus brassicae]QDH19560.1 hypothetical protein FFV09_01020 [Saccharibacillus brassicae]